MKSILFLLLFISFNSFSQINFISDSVRNSLHPEIENQIFKNVTEFQFRVWIKDNSLRNKDEGLLLLSYINKNWFCEVFKYKYFNGLEQLIKVHEQNKSSDSLIHFLNQDSIPDLPDMSTFEYKMCYYDEGGSEIHVIITNGPRYIFEFVTKDEFKRIEYHNPIYYNETYEGFSELKKISNLVKFIHRTFPMLPIYSWN